MENVNIKSIVIAKKNQHEYEMYSSVCQAWRLFGLTLLFFLFIIFVNSSFAADNGFYAGEKSRIINFNANRYRIADNADDKIKININDAKEIRNLQKAYENQKWGKKQLICARILDCLSAVANNISYFPTASSKKTDQKNKNLKKNIDQVIELSKIGKSMENNRQAFIVNERKHVEKLLELEKQLIPAYDKVRYELLKKFPTITAEELPSLPVIAAY